MVPVRPDWKTTLSGVAAEALACSIAARRLPGGGVPGGPSLRLVTVKVAACAGPAAARVAPTASPAPATAWRLLSPSARWSARRSFLRLSRLLIRPSLDRPSGGHDTIQR